MGFNHDGNPCGTNHRALILKLSSTLILRASFKKQNINLLEMIKARKHPECITAQTLNSKPSESKAQLNLRILDK
jgi:hypothetical protein